MVVMDLFGLPLSLLMGFVCSFILFVCISFVQIENMDSFGTLGALCKLCKLCVRHILSSSSSSLCENISYALVFEIKSFAWMVVVVSVAVDFDHTLLNTIF